ncbi:outer membrane protein assembly factor BamB family protein [Aeoliella mucimassa]|uniref:Outer membrane biogenesis protein BamB n=1 Tax=Aeoliella mucimassa TaxID=2527972 RepID=A0A518AP60_9BACT|nr:PQQ-binding-like beta-propeller repeat protein [Aeoliella mucimassa]QDU56508.1 outer membrane biogenesis protein BamB [Aeoliella mucimassa]
MTAAELIDTLEAKELLPKETADKLRKKIAKSSKPLTAKSLARFLIEKGHLSKQDVVEALAAGGEVKLPPPEPSSTGEPSGVDLPMEDLQDLSSSSEWTMDGESGAFAEPTGGAMEAAEPTSKKKRKKSKKGNEWDSPLLLIGGGSLVFMVVVGLLIYWIMFAENADNILGAARDDMEAGSYGNAIANYEKFVESYQSNAEYSTARVELAMARIRQRLETSDEKDAFEVAEKELNAIGSEPDFHVAEEDLSALLPRIARGLADKAEASKDPAVTDDLAARATRALEMANNTKYIPKSRRDNTELEEILATLDTIAKRQQSLSDLAAALKQIEELNGQGDASAAFAVQEELVDKHPTLLNNQELLKALQSISETEQKNISYVEEPVDASTSERDNNVVATLAVANRRITGTSPATGAVCVVVDGAAYGIDSSTGNVLWRRYTGPSTSPQEALSIESDVILIDWRMPEPNKVQQSLVRVNAETGQLVWRLELDDQVAAPTLAGNRLLLAGASGKLHVVDAKSGARAGYVQFSQPLTTTPTFDPNKGVVYLTGERSSFYSVSINDMSCLGVYFTKHARGSIVAPPVVAIDKVVVVENDGADTSKVLLFSTTANGAIDKQLGAQRLTGRVVTQPLVDGRRITFITDRGQIAVYEVSVGADGDALTLVAQKSDRSAQPRVSFGHMLDGHVWVAESSLVKYAISPTGNRLNAVGLKNDYNRSQYVTPLAVRGDVVIHTRGRRRKAGFTVTASNSSDGSPYWETDIATPAAGNPLASANPLALLEADANGKVYRFDPEAIKTRVQNDSLENPLGNSDETVYSYSNLLADGAAVFAAEDAAHVLLYSPSAPKPLSKIDLAAPLAASPTTFGKGWVAPLKVGQVFVLDAESGKPIAAPFQPTLEAGRTLHWKPASVYDQDRLLITDGATKLYMLEVGDDGAPALTAASEATLNLTPLSTGFTVAGDVAVAIAANGQLSIYKLPELEPLQSVNPGGRVVWGPHAAGETVVLATAKSLTAIDSSGAATWQVPLETGALAGTPLTDGGSMIVAAQDGTILRINLADGSIAGRADAGEPIAAGPVKLGNRLVVSARDGSLLVVDAP